MPPNAHDVAARALEAANTAGHAAEIGRLVGEAAKQAADSAKMTAESMVREMRERFDRQDVASEEWRGKVMSEIQGQNRTFDAFKSDFENQMDEIDRRCTGHNETLHGSREKNLAGIVPKVEKHEDWISRLVWTWGLVILVIGGLSWYIMFFYGEAMKRGIFNPSEEEWRWRVTKEVRKNVKPDSLVPQPSPGNP